MIKEFFILTEHPSWGRCMQRIICLGLFVFSLLSGADAWSAITASPNPSTTGNITLTWDSVVVNTEYRVTESLNGAAANEVYSGTGQQVSLTGRVNGSYKYELEFELCFEGPCVYYVVEDVTVVVSGPTPVPVPTPTPVPPSGADFTSNSYEVYLGYVNSDAAKDIYLHAKEQFVLLHAEIAIPLFIPPKESYEIYSFKVTDPSIEIDHDGETYWIGQSHLELAQPVVVEPQYSDDEIAESGLQLLIENKDYFIGDFDGDGTQDIFIVYFDPQTGIIGSNPEFILIKGAGSQSGLPEVGGAGHSMLVHELDIFSGDTTFVVRDVDGDGKDELVALGDFSVADTAFDISGENRFNGANYLTDVNIKSPTLVGTSDGSFRVTEMGAAVYSMPISLPAGTAGVAPQVGISYSSQGGEGQIGWGGSITGLQSIARCRQTLAQDGEAKPITWSDEDRFCMGGSRLVAEPGYQYGAIGAKYKTEIDSFVYVSSFGGTAGHPEYFTVEAKDGSVRYFGNTVTSQQNNDSGSTLTWALNKFEDSVGNAIDYVYSQNSGDNFHISQIFYAYGTNSGANNTDLANASVEFVFEARMEPSTKYIAGDSFRDEKRLAYIRVLNNEPGSNGGSGLSEIRRYNMLYTKATVISRYRRNYLQAVQECVGNDCLPATKFEWADNKGFSFDSYDYSWSDKMITGDDAFGQFVPLDINGDGYMDFAWIEENESHQAYDMHLRFSIFDPETQGFQQSTFSDGQKYLFYGEDWTKPGSDVHITPLDYNGDGRYDIAVFGDEDDEWNVYLSTPMDDGTWALTATPILLSSRDKTAVFLDLDSDGMTDMLTQAGVSYLRQSGAAVSSSTYYQFSGTDPVTYFGEDGDELSSSFNMSGVDAIDEVNYTRRFVPAGDLNGDGRADILLVDRVLIINCSRNNKPASSCGGQTGYRGSLKRLEEFYYFMTQELGESGELEFHFYDSMGSWVETDVDNVTGSILSPLSQFVVQDLNGDGLSDVIKGDWNGGGVDYYSYLNSGSGFMQRVPAAEFINSYRGDREKSIQPQMVDMNGDGYADLLFSSAYGGIEYYEWNISSGKFNDTTKRVNYRLAGTLNLFYDTTGDGHLDIIKYKDKHLYLYPNQVTGLNDLVTEITNGLGAKTTISYESLLNTDHYDGIEYLGSGSSQESHSFARGNQTISWQPSSGATSVSSFYSAINQPYAGIDSDAQSFSANFMSPVLEYMAPLYLVTRIEGSAPSANPSEAGSIDALATSGIEYVYEQAKLRAAGRGFLGFKSLTTIDWQSGIKTQTQYRQDWPFIGSPLQTTIYTASNDVLSSKVNEWAIVGWDSNPTWGTQIGQGVGTESLAPFSLYVKENVDTSFVFNSDTNDETQITAQTEGTQQSVFQSITTKQEFDAYGNPYEIEVLTEGNGLSLSKKTINSYSANGSGLVNFADGRSLNYLQLGRLTSTEVVTTKNLLTSSRYSEFTYYQSGPEAGMLYEEIIEPDLGDEYRVKTTHAYDAFGNENVTTVTGTEEVFNFAGNVVSSLPINRSSTAYFDSVGRYTNYSVNSLGQKSSEIVERNKYGAAAVITSENNQLRTTILYDVLGREAKRSDSTGAWSKSEYLSCSQVSPGCPTSAVYAVKSTGANGAQTLQYHDVLTRIVRKGGLTFTGGDVFVSSEYDTSGRVLRVSEPHLNLVVSDYWTTQSYDVLGRTVLTTLPDGSTASTRYMGRTTVVSNDLLQTTRQVKNGLNQLIEVTDNNGGRLEYEYSFDGKMENVISFPPGVTQENGTNSAGETTTKTSLSYDTLGRKIGMTDPDKGSWVYKYNALGNLVWQRDGKGQVVTQSYDKLGRLMGRTDYLAGGEVENHTSWYFDSANDIGQNIPYAVGQVTAVVISNSVADVRCDSASAQQCTRYSYDNYSRSDTTKVIVRENMAYADTANDSQHSYTSRAHYDSIGRAYKTEDVLSGIVLDKDTDQPILSGTEVEFTASGHLKKVTDLYSGTVLQDVTSKNIRGQITQMNIGVVTRTNSYHEATGLIKRKIAFTGALSFTAQDQTYTWDSIGNLLRRDNQSHRLVGGGLTESVDQQENFCYDNLNRLSKTYMGPHSETYCSTLAPANQDMRYSSSGNISYKNGVGNYTYAETGYAGPHAVTATSDGASYYYDQNGNMTSSTGGQGDRTLEYTSYDKPKRIERGNHRIEFKYGANRSRYWRQSTNTDSGEVETTIYLGNVEKVITSDEVVWRRQVPGGVINYDTVTEGTKYGMTGDERLTHIFNDHLGSVDVITDAGGFLEQSMSFDPWGHRRNNETLVNLSVLELITFDREITTRGFTGHEMLDKVGLIHMNGRIYDARLARFMQADPFVQAATNTQSYNRYSYAWNNPLNAIDPSGFVHWNYVRRAANQTFAVVASVVASYFCGGTCGPAVYAAIAAVGAALNGADFKGIVIAAVSAYAMASIGGNTSWNPGTKVFASGVVGGITSVLQGGKFGHGFVAAGLGAAAGNIKFGTGPVAAIARVGTGAIVGGTSTAISGGKFANGAATGAFAAAVQVGASKKAEGSAANKLEELKLFARKQLKALESPDSLTVEFEVRHEKVKTVTTIDMRGKVVEVSDLKSLLNPVKIAPGVVGFQTKNGFVIDMGRSPGGRARLGLKLSSDVSFSEKQSSTFLRTEGFKVKTSVEVRSSLINYNVSGTSHISVQDLRQRILNQALPRVEVEF